MVSKEYLLGLIGFPLDHSLSPAIHAAALRALDLDGEYRLYPVPPLPPGAAVMEDHLEMLRQGDLVGLNVTIPHKQSILPLLDALTPTAQAIGASNTIYYHDGLLWGDNTDAAGFMADLNYLGWSFSAVDNPHALILGAGGSARAVSYALLQNGWSLTMAARRQDQAQDLVHNIQKFSRASPNQGGDNQLTAIHLDSISLIDLDPTPSLIINTTPLGMSPFQDGSSWPESAPFPSQAAVYDLVYNPPETRLISAARDAGLSVTNGLGMLIEQAALSFETWTGFTAPIDVMRKAAEDYKIGAS
ncbi:MAG: shikimate dehydrogenase [Anaerolineales bacterium]